MRLIQLENIYVNSVSGCSGIFIGENAQLFFQSTNETNTGLGTVTGDQNSIVANNSAVIHLAD